MPALKTYRRPAAKAATASTRTITEFVGLFEGTAQPQIDRANGVIRNVKILGKESKNDGGKRVYSDEAMDDAARLYENIPVNFDHPAVQEANRDRTFGEGVGWLKNVSRNGDSVRGDLHVLKSHPHAEMLFEAAERNPAHCGLSHNAQGDCERTVDGMNVVRKIHSARSVDVVRRPATNETLFESHPAPASKGRKMKTLKISELLEAHPILRPAFDAKYREGILEGAAAFPFKKGGKPVEEDMDNQPGYEDAPVDVPDDADSPDTGSGSNPLLALLMQVIGFLVKSMGKSQTMERRMKESKFGPDAIQGEEVTEPAGGQDNSGAPGPGGAKGTAHAPQTKQVYQEAIESAVNKALKPLLERQDASDARALLESDRAECVALFESLNREPDALLVKAAMGLKTKADRTKLIESLPEKEKAVVRHPRPLRSPSLLESQAESGIKVLLPKDTKELCASLARGNRPTSLIGENN
jgi:hypothetical protein